MLRGSLARISDFPALSGRGPLTFEGVRLGPSREPLARVQGAGTGVLRKV